MRYIRMVDVITNFYNILLVTKRGTDIGFTLIKMRYIQIIKTTASETFDFESSYK